MSPTDFLAPGSAEQHTENMQGTNMYTYNQMQSRKFCSQKSVHAFASWDLLQRGMANYANMIEAHSHNCGLYIILYHKHE